jgi:transcriptional regulator with XRE-family HTH domain
MGQPSSTRRLLAQRIRILRIFRGWSQEQLGDYCGLHRTYIGAVERAERNITIDNLDKIAVAFAVPVSRLFGEGDLLDWPVPGVKHRIEEARASYHCTSRPTSPPGNQYPRSMLLGTRH